MSDNDLHMPSSIASTTSKGSTIMPITLTADDKRGHQTFHVEPGTHTIVLDTARLRQKAIADFIDELQVRYRTHSANAVNEDLAIAIGWFDVPLDMIYPTRISSISQLDDKTLAMIVRLRMEREELEKTND